MAAVFEGRRRCCIRCCGPWSALSTVRPGVREEVEQRWTQYAASLLAFSFVRFFVLYLIQRLQGFCRSILRASARRRSRPDLAFNTAVSFMTNTNWQAYSGESTFSYFVQMAGT